MIGNDLYNRLRRMKQNKSFTELIKSLLDKNNDKTGAGLRECAGLLDKEDVLSETALKESRGAFKRWTKKYV